ncbi:hypothetical protein FBY41_4466 [Humibacillus xanthopallidus]|uniref:Uncharacterized protein n=1 Tax=Humibacillus xanthopallidus TaxID=412689 RepID=A0A543H9Z1_9MICO|nr:hypothetical protein FBY41_4466 [Humibacillus xanthopallidus]
MAAVFVVLLVLLGVPVGGSAGAVAPLQPVPSLTPAVKPDRTRALVTLTKVTPTVVAPGTDVTVTGVVTAPLTGPLTAPTVQVRLGSRDITTRPALDDWASGRTTNSGRRVAETTLADIAAGDEAPFSVVVPAAELRNPDAFAALPISVEVVQQGASAAIGMTRTFLAWNSRKEFEPIQVATLMPVTLDPVVELFSQEQAVRDAAWSKVIGPGSRLGRLVEGTKGSPVTLAVDPAVFGPAVEAVRPGTSGSTGSTVTPTTTPTTTPTGTTSSAPSTTPAPPSGTPSATPSVGATTDAGGTGQAAGPDAVVSDLADQLAADLRGRPVIALPYADADVAASGAINPADPPVRALVGRSSLVAEELGSAARGDIAWPVDGLLPNGREKQLKAIWAGSTVKKVAGIVVDQRAITADSPYTPTARRVAAGGTRLLGYDARLSALLPRRSDPTPVLSTQRYLAESLVLLGERAGTPRSALVVAPRTYDTDPRALSTFLEATSNVPWLEPVDATSLLTDRSSERAVAQQRPAQAPPSAAPAPTLTTARLAQMATQRSTMLSVSEVLANGDVVAATYGELLDELTSARWRWNRAGWTTLGTSVSADITAATRAIRVVPRSVNLFAERGTLQVTVVNGLDDVVENIRLLLVPNNPRIQIVEQPGPITIQPGSRAIVPVQVAAVAAGKVEIMAYLTTADGTVIGTPAAIRVQANPLDSTIYWAGGTLIGIVLLAGIARTVLRGTSRIDEIEDIEAVTAAHAAGEDLDPR